eukprot:2659506-Pyramimonas_sp.AAC.1
MSFVNFHDRRVVLLGFNEIRRFPPRRRKRCCPRVARPLSCLYAHAQVASGWRRGAMASGGSYWPRHARAAAR